MKEMNTDPTLEIRSLASGIRSVALIFVLIISYFNVRLAFQINYFRSIFDDMLGDQSRPALTAFVTQNNTLFVLLSLLLPIAAVVIVLVVRNHKAALFSLSGLMVLTFIQMHLMWTALFAPLMTVINGMSHQ